MEYKKHRDRTHLCIGVMDYQHEYLRTMAAFRGISMMKYIEGLIADDMRRNGEKYARVLSLRGEMYAEDTHAGVNTMTDKFEQEEK